MKLINKFIDSYSKEYDFYLRTAQLSTNILGNGLETNGIRAIVSYRAKRPDRLEEKSRVRYRYIEVV